MLGPTSPGVASFRMQNTYEIMSPVFVVQITENNLSHASSFFGPKRGLRKLYSTAERVGVLDSP
jgi:hypothetical protein